MSNSNVFTQLQKLLPAGELRLDDKTRQEHAGDKWFASHLPDAVALPRTSASVAKILGFANEHGIPVTPRGAGHGYVGGCVPVQGGIALSLARMKKIKEIHPDDFVAVVQPGVNVKEFQETVEKQRLYYPPDPASRADCSIGGTIATNAGGPRCLKYGVTRDYILGIEVALANGTLVRFGSRTHKNKSGFDFTRLFVGSEGLLGIVTEATLKLIPLPPFHALVVVGFDKATGATEAIRAVFRAGFLPCALEVADSFTLAAARKYTGSKRLAGCNALLFVELDGQERSVRQEIAALAKMLRAQKPVMLEKAFGNEACEALWQIRRDFSASLKATGLIKLNEDIAVPRGRLTDLFDFAAKLQKKYDLPVACFGHAGDGNIHCNVMYDKTWKNVDQRTAGALNELFRQVIDWGGVITGEHGIGLAKKKWWPMAASEELRQLHHDLKRTLDPKGILNPGKFVE